MKKLAIILSLLCSSPLYGAVAYVGSSTPVVDNTGTATSSTVTYSPTAGNCVFIGVGSSAAATISSVKDNNNVAYPQRSIAQPASSAFSYAYALCNVTSGITSFTITYTAGPAFVFVVGEYSGASGIGQSAVAGSAAGLTAGTTSTTTQASNNTVVSMFMLADGSTPVATAGNMRQNAIFHGVATGAMFDNSNSSPASTTNSLTWTTASAYSVSSVEFSTASTNYTQIASGAATATTLAQAFTFPSVVGNYIVAAGYDGLGTGSNITFTDGGDSFTQLAPSSSVSCNLSVDGDTIGASFAKIGTGGQLTVTMADGGNSSGKRIMLVEVSGLTGSGALDKTSTCVDSGASNVTTQTTGNMVTTSANEFIFGVFGASANGLVYTAGSNYILFSTTVAAADEGRSVSSTGTYTASITTNSAAELAGFAASFIAATVTPPVHHNMPPVVY